MAPPAGSARAYPCRTVAGSTLSWPRAWLGRNLVVSVGLVRVRPLVCLGAPFRFGSPAVAHVGFALAVLVASSVGADVRAAERAGCRWRLRRRPLLARRLPGRAGDRPARWPLRRPRGDRGLTGQGPGLVLCWPSSAASSAWRSWPSGWPRPTSRPKRSSSSWSKAGRPRPGRRGWPSVSGSPGKCTTCSRTRCPGSCSSWKAPGCWRTRPRRPSAPRGHRPRPPPGQDRPRRGPPGDRDAPRRRPPRTRSPGGTGRPVPGTTGAFPASSTVSGEDHPARLRGPPWRSTGSHKKP